MSKIDNVVAQSFDEQRVQLIDWSPLEKAISKKIGEEVEVRIGTGYVPNCVYDWDDIKHPYAKNLIIDAECCGRQSTYTHICYLDEEQDATFDLDRSFITIPFYRKKRIEGNKTVMAMFPSIEIDIDTKSIEKCLTGEVISLYEHCKSRWNYNPRVSSNIYNTEQAIYGDDYNPAHKYAIYRDTGKKKLDAKAQDFK